MLFPSSFVRRTAEGGREIETKRWERNEREEFRDGSQPDSEENARFSRGDDKRSGNGLPRGAEDPRESTIESPRMKDYTCARCMYILSFIFVRVPGAMEVMASRSLRSFVLVFSQKSFLFFFFRIVNA